MEFSHWISIPWFVWGVFFFCHHFCTPWFGTPPHPCFLHAVMWLYHVIIYVSCDHVMIINLHPAWCNGMTSRCLACHVNMSWSQHCILHVIMRSNWLCHVTLSLVPCMLSCDRVMWSHPRVLHVGPPVQVKISDQSYSIGAIMGKDPTEVKEAKSSRINTHIEQVDMLPITANKTTFIWHCVLDFALVLGVSCL